MTQELPKIWMIATDGSRYADLSAAYAARLYTIMPEKPSVWLVNVVSDPGRVGPDGLKKEISQAENLLKKASERFPADEQRDDKVKILVEVGDPRKKLVEMLKRLEVEHLFMGGADFRSAPGDLASGGITNYMLHHLKGMVTIIK
jgi:nucleotide-binding universal stress UspA family protein